MPKSNKRTNYIGNSTTPLTDIVKEKERTPNQDSPILRMEGWKIGKGEGVKEPFTLTDSIAVHPTQLSHSRPGAT